MTGLHPLRVRCLRVAAQTPLGRSSAASAAAVRCHLSGIAEHPVWRDSAGEPLLVATATWLDVEGAPWRAQALGMAAAEELLQGDEVPVMARRRLGVGLFVALSPLTVPRADDRNRVVGALTRSVTRLLTTVPTTVRGFATGHGGGVDALLAAARALEAGEVDAALVIGADSWIDIEILEAQDDRGALLTPERGAGFIPGEGAGGLLLVRSTDEDDDSVEARGAAGAALIGVAVADEHACQGTATVCVGEALSAAMSGALPSGALIHDAVTDLNGEPYRADEFAMSTTRFADRHADVSRFAAPAENWGDTGAASAVLGCTLPLVAWQRDYGVNGPVAVWSSSAWLPRRGVALWSQVESS
ncbi:MAG: hypothetical protein MUE41_01420 [Gemmatimonadaceae bacterium]|jgi:3-oxoacyl-[acyl-carrier-protein] synthase-1|nr:hypothetical protein [Gemmatimonadaceae bacterium]